MLNRVTVAHSRAGKTTTLCSFHRSSEGGVCGGRIETPPLTKTQKRMLYGLRGGQRGSPIAQRTANPQPSPHQPHATKVAPPGCNARSSRDGRGAARAIPRSVRRLGVGDVGPGRGAAPRPRHRVDDLAPLGALDRHPGNHHAQARAPLNRSAGLNRLSPGGPR